MIYSASFARLRDEGFTNRFLLNRQLLFAVVGVVAAGVVAAVPYRRFRTWSVALYGAGIVLLVVPRRRG